MVCAAFPVAYMASLIVVFGVIRGRYDVWYLDASLVVGVRPAPPVSFNRVNVSVHPFINGGVTLVPRYETDQYGQRIWIPLWPVLVLPPVLVGWRAARRLRHIDPGACVHCGYLKWEIEVCPECGRPVTEKTEERIVERW